MAKSSELFKRMKTRERVLLIVAILVLFCIGVDRYMVSPFLESINETKEQLDHQEKLLSKYYSFVVNKKRYEARLEELDKYYASFREKFLLEETEELAYAKLQELINNLANKNKLVVSRSTALKKEVIDKTPYLIALTISFDISDFDSSQKLQSFLYDIEYNNEKLLFVDSIRIKTLGLNITKGATISAVLTAIASIEKKS
jgi:general secretion pathway protein M